MQDACSLNPIQACHVIPCASYLSHKDRHGVHMATVPKIAGKDDSEPGYKKERARIVYWELEYSPSGFPSPVMPAEGAGAGAGVQICP